VPNFNRLKTNLTTSSIRIAFVLHVMQVAGAEVLVFNIIQQLGKKIDPIVFCLDSIGQLGEQLRHIGIPVVNFGRRAGIDINVAFKMSKEIRKRHIEIVHAHQYTPFFYSALAKAVTLQKFKLIFTEHGRHYPDVVSVKRRLANRYLLSRCADDINAVSIFSARALAEKDGFPINRIHVIKNGIVPEKYNYSIDKKNAKEKVGLDSERRYLICVARFHPVKDHATLLNAFSKIIKKLSDVDLLLVGDGSLKSLLEQQAMQLGISPRIHFLGVRKDVSDLMHASDVFVLTSVSEAASITLLEAMASSLPVVVTNVGGNPEIVEDEINGFLVARGDADEIAKACIRLFTNDVLCSQMGRKGCEFVNEKYLLTQTIDKYNDLYVKMHGLL
jgi:glycosyltransferase involved in cell wall biosynthesis